MASAKPLSESRRPLGAGAFARPKVSLVNEDEAVRVSLVFLFRTTGFEARGYVSGRTLLASRSARRSDCFVLDHKPRGPDGLQLARRLRALGLSAPIVLTVGFPCGALEALASVDRVIAAAQVDDELIRRLKHEIAQARGAAAP